MIVLRFENFVHSAVTDKCMKETMKKDKWRRENQTECNLKIEHRKKCYLCEVDGFIYAKENQITYQFKFKYYEIWMM